MWASRTTFPKASPILKFAKEKVSFVGREKSSFFSTLWIVFSQEGIVNIRPNLIKHDYFSLCILAFCLLVGKGYPDLYGIRKLFNFVVCDRPIKLDTLSLKNRLLLEYDL